METQEETEQEQGIIQFESVEERRRQVFHLKTRGHTQQEIADMFGLHRQTIVKDLKVHKQKIKDSQEKINRDEYVAEVRADFEQMREELWKDHAKAKKAGDRVRIMNTIAKLRAAETKLLHDCDLLEKAPQRFEHNHNVSGTVQHLQVDLSESMLESVETMIISQHMQRTPENLLLLRGRDPEYIDVPAKSDGMAIQDIEPAQIQTKSSTVEQNEGELPYDIQS